MNWVRLAVLVLDLAGDIVRWIEREKIRTEAERAIFRERVRKHNENVFEARALRARTAAELERLSDVELRQHPDANFRD